MMLIVGDSSWKGIWYGSPLSMRSVYRTKSHFLILPIEHVHLTQIYLLYHLLGMLSFVVPQGLVLLIKSHYTCFGRWTGTVCWLQWIQSSSLEIGPQMQGSTGVETSYTLLVRMIYVLSLSSTKIFSQLHTSPTTPLNDHSSLHWPKSTSPWPHQHKTWGSGPLCLHGRGTPCNCFSTYSGRQVLQQKSLFGLHLCNCPIFLFNSIQNKIK
jgi:hypothetical protein